LAVCRHIQHWIPEVNAILSKLSLSQKNQQHLAERVDYYGAKMKRQPVDNQRLYLLCHLQSRWQQGLERIGIINFTGWDQFILPCFRSQVSTVLRP